MKKAFLLISASALMLTSCGGGGWASSEKEEVRKICAEVGDLDCDCVLKEYMEKYPDFSDFAETGMKNTDMAMSVAKKCLKK